MFMGLLRLFQASAVLPICLVGLLGGSSAGAQKQESRVIVEARALFKAVDRGTSSRCRFDRSWDRRPVLAETAKRYLKLVLRADLVVSEPPATPMQIIDPAGRDADAFCTFEERSAAWQAAVAALPAGDDAVLRLTSISYGFPVFNADFTRAAMVGQTFGETWRRAADGTLRRSIEAAGGAEVYARRGRVWQRIDYESYDTAH
jgi:hypothetical protein